MRQLLKKQTNEPSGTGISEAPWGCFQPRDNKRCGICLLGFADSAKEEAGEGGSRGGRRPAPREPADPQRTATWLPTIAPPARCCLVSHFFRRSYDSWVVVKISLFQFLQLSHILRRHRCNFCRLPPSPQIWPESLQQARHSPSPGTQLSFLSTWTVLLRSRWHHAEDTEQSQERGKLRPWGATSPAGRHSHTGGWSWWHTRRTIPPPPPPPQRTHTQLFPREAWVCSEVAMGQVWAGKPRMPKLRLRWKDCGTEANLSSGIGYLSSSHFNKNLTAPREGPTLGIFCFSC